MKRLLFYIFFFLFVHVVVAQQRPQYTQYMFNNILLNPAVTGIENYTDVKAGYRTQWTGLNGAPVTSYLTINAPLGKEFVQGDAGSFSAGGGENPFSRSFTQEYMAAAPHHGIGATIITDRAGPITQTNLNANYAYHLGLSARANLAVGVAAGVMRTSLNTAEITLENAFDPAIANGNNSQFQPDLSVGAWLYSSNYYVGISAQQILPQSLYLKSTSVDVIKTVPHYFFTAGVKLFVSDDITLMPSVLVKQIKPVPLTYDLNLKTAFRDKFWIGGSYRHGDSFSAMAGFYLGSFLNVGYSYDVTTSALNTVSNGTHELVIGILLNNRYKVTCPTHGF